MTRLQVCWRGSSCNLATHIPHLHVCCRESHISVAAHMQAQQRYRERRKQKFSEMEQSLHMLASQVEQMSNVQSQNSMLQVRSVHALSMPLFPCRVCPDRQLQPELAANKQQLAH